MYTFQNDRWNTNTYATAENQTKLDFVGNFIQSMVEEISSLKNQLATETAENAKNERVAAAEKYASELEAQNKKLRQQFRMGINSDDTEKTSEWWRAHTEQERDTYAQKNQPLPKVFHRVHYIITPTELGIIKEAKCSCGQILDLTGDDFG